MHVDHRYAVLVGLPLSRRQVVPGIVSAPGLLVRWICCHFVGPVLVEMIVHLGQWGGHTDKRLPPDIL